MSSHLPAHRRSVLSFGIAWGQTLRLKTAAWDLAVSNKPAALCKVYLAEHWRFLRKTYQAPFYHPTSFRKPQDALNFGQKPQLTRPHFRRMHAFNS